MRYLRKRKNFLVFVVAAIVLASCVGKTKMTVDSYRLGQLEQDTENNAIAAAMGIDINRGTSLSIIERQRKESAKQEENVRRREFASEGVDVVDVEAGTNVDVNTNGTDTDLTDPFDSEDLATLHVNAFTPDPPTLNICWTNGVAGAAVDILTKYEIDGTNDWALAEEYQVPPSATNVVVALSDWPTIVSNLVERAIFPEYHSMSKAFFACCWATDFDKDGLSDLAELWFYETDPYLEDSDGDGLRDGDEILMGTNPKLWDTDGDGVSDGREAIELNSNPRVQDSDGDNVPDGVEVSLGMDPNAQDSDMDGLSDGYEIDNDLNPTSSDSDGDGTPDFDEVRDGGDPNCDERLPEPDGLIHYTVVGSASVSWTPESSDATNCNEIVMSNDVSGIGFSTWSDKGAFSVGGCAFIPNETGIYHFELVADDVGSAFVGGLELKGSWVRGLGYVSAPTSGVFIAGQEYSIGASLTNDGGPAVLGFGKFGEFEPIRRASLDADLSASVIIYEDAYYNNPEQPMIPKASTKAVYRFRANGGSFGARLSFDVENGDCLGGPSLSLMNTELGVNQTFARTFIYEGVSPSGEKDDVRIIARLVENETGETASITSKVTVVKVEPRAVLSSSADKHRHVFGPYEPISVLVWPQEDDIEISLGGSCVTEESVNMPRSKGEVDLSVRYMGMVFDTALSVIYPIKVVSSNIRYATAEDWIERGKPYPIDPWLGAIIDIHLEPTCVSFVPLTFLEGVSSATKRTGVFSGSEVYIPYHSGFPESTNEASIMSGNEIAGGDLIGIAGFEVVEGFEAGGYEYQIPLYWSFADQGFPKNATRFGKAIQRYTLSSDCKLTVSKYRRAVSRRITPVSPTQGD